MLGKEIQEMRNERFLPILVWALIAATCLGSRVAYAQGLSGTLTGTVVDQSNAVVPNAAVALKDENTGALRRTISNEEGFFSISPIPAGTYTVLVEAQGFARLERTGVVIHPGDKINVPDLALTVATVAQQVQVEATPAVVIPVDSGEKSDVIVSKEIQDLSIIGRNAVELLRLVPGVVNNERYSHEITQFMEGDGPYFVQGTRNDALNFVSDGTDTIITACNSCGSMVTPNVEMVQEFKVQTANFSAENTRGPVVMQTVSKAGTSNFHGEAYLFTRQYKLNSNDWLANLTDTAKPKNTFYYTGFNIGGPVLIPHSSFNRNRNKMFFFAATEIQRQKNDIGVNQAWVPTEAMRRGDFTDLAYLDSLSNAPDVNIQPCQPDSEGNLPSYCAGVGLISPGAIDPGGQILMNVYPLPNRNPATTNGYNYVSDVVDPENRRQDLVRIDYNISDNTKLYTRFNHETEDLGYPYTLWWVNATQIPFPGEPRGKNHSYSTSTSFVHVFNPTTTNEVVFGASMLHMPAVFQQPDKVSRQALGYPYKGVFGGSTDLIPSVTDWSAGVGTIINPGGFNPNQYINDSVTTLTDNFSKVYKTHLLKFGAYFQLSTNGRPTWNYDQSLLVPTNWGGNTTGNAYADLLTGRIGYYQETSTNIIIDQAQREFAFYAQDSWKATKRLTIELGARFYHLGWMYDRNGHIHVFEPSLYDPNAPIDSYTGLLAAYKGDNVPDSGFPTPALRVGPRFGFAYDLTGKGRTVLRGGVGGFLYRDRGDVSSLSVVDPPLQQSITFASAAGNLPDFEHYQPTDIKYDLDVMDPKDNRVPTTYSWSLTLSQRLRSDTLLEVSYVGNTSRNQISPNNYNLNVVPEGAMLNSPNDDPNDYRPYQSYGNIAWRSHILNQHYDSLQITAKRQTGRINYDVSYAFGKALGMSGHYYGPGVDPFDRRGRSYGPLDSDRTHSLTIAYNILLPDPVKDNAFLRQVANGWQVTGITEFQSGAPFDPSISGTMADGQAISSVTVAGTPDTAVRPVLVCDPRDGLDMTTLAGFAGRQYANPNCFAAPSPGHNGMYQLPYLKTPAYMNHDVSLFKNFRLSQTHENLKLQFRFSAFNFINHPNAIFQGGDPGTQLNFDNGVLDENSIQNFGRPIKKQGKRILQFALKFMF
jgi:hypothetical protein